MRTFWEKADNFIKWFLRFLCGGMLLYLLYLSMFSTSAVELRNFSDTVEEDWGNYNYYLPDSGILCLAVLILVALVFLLVNHLIHEGIWERLERYRGFLYLVFAAAGLLFIGFTRLEPVSDPGKVLNIAEGMAAGDFTEFMPNEGYLWRCPHQMGIVLFCYCLTILFGEYNYLVFQVLNLVALIGGMEAAGGIAGRLWPEKGASVRWKVRLMYVLFIPYLLYVTFIYGTIPAFALSLGAMHMELLFIQEKKWWFGILAAVLIGAAIALKPNSQIMLVAMVLFLVYDWIMEEKKVRTLAVIVLTLLLQALFSLGVDSFMSRKSGYEVSEGQAMLGYVAMGLQESRFGPGAYNGRSVSLYEQAGYDTREASRLAWESIQLSLKRLAQDRSEAVRWLGRKIASQWNEPSFGSIDVNRGREGAPEIPDLFESVIDGRAGYILLGYLNLFQPVILAGGVLYFYLSGQKQRRENFLLIVTVFGGFLFHICQYVFPYFLLIFPYSVQGWEYLADRLDRLYGRLRERKPVSVKKAVMAAGIAAMCIAVPAAVYHTRLFQYMIAVQDTTQLQAEYEQTVEKNCHME